MGDNGKENGNYYSILGLYLGGCQIMVPFWIPIVIRHLIFRVPKRDHKFDNTPYTGEVARF